MQSINIPALLHYPYVRLFNRRLAIPHLQVKTINDIDVKKLKKQGFKGIIFDIDNTLTLPYKYTIQPSIKKKVSEFKKAFGKNIVILSNYAGTKDDKGYFEKRKIEKNIGITVLTHDQKKPGNIKAVRQYFKCKPYELVIIGDRLFSEIVFGNKQGMLTILTEPFTEKGDNKAAAFARPHEQHLLKRWMNAGHKAKEHPLLKSR